MSYGYESHKLFETMTRSNDEMASSIARLNPIENLWTMFKEAFHKRLVQEAIKSSTCSQVLQCYGELMKEVWKEQAVISAGQAKLRPDPGSTGNSRVSGRVGLRFSKCAPVFGRVELSLKSKPVTPVSY